MADLNPSQMSCDDGTVTHDRNNIADNRGWQYECEHVTSFQIFPNFKRELTNDKKYYFPTIFQAMD